MVYHGPFHGEFIEDRRNLSYDEIVSGWKHGTVDASWFCVKCWMERLDFDSEARTREAIGLPPASIPSAIRDNRFHQHTSRWCVCDNCESYCTGRARDYLPGSFAYAKDNSLAGPPRARRGCFPTLHYREKLWRSRAWNATFLCRGCLVKEWKCTPQEIEQWLVLHHPGSEKAASIHRWRQSGTAWSSWHGGWDGSNRGNRWTQDSEGWK